jgi:carbonic anhydrase
MDHRAESIIITCIDFRFQEFINYWISKNLTPKSFDRVALAGGVKDLESILGQIEIAVRLHHVNKVIVINHEDCGAYGKEGTPEKHSQDLRKAKLEVNKRHPELSVEVYYLRLDKTLIPIV